MPRKVEGIAVVTPEVLAVANDNDFGLVDETLLDAGGQPRERHRRDQQRVVR